MKTAFACFLIISTLGSVLAAPPTKPVDQLVEQYYIIQKSLSADSITGVSAAAAQVATISRRSVRTEPQLKIQLTDLSNAATKLQTADLKSARNGFGELSDKLIAYLKSAGVKKNPPFQFYCPMVKKNWLQPNKETRNPYYGSSMLTCGELVQP
jgi:hypothetical protein